MRLVLRFKMSWHSHANIGDNVYPNTFSDFMEPIIKYHKPLYTLAATAAGVGSDFVSTLVHPFVRDGRRFINYMAPNFAARHRSLQRPTVTGYAGDVRLDHLPAYDGRDGYVEQPNGDYEHLDAGKAYYKNAEGWWTLDQERTMGLRYPINVIGSEAQKIYQAGKLLGHVYNRGKSMYDAYRRSEYGRSKEGIQWKRAQMGMRGVKWTFKPGYVTKSIKRKIQSAQRRFKRFPKKKRAFKRVY